MMQRALAAVVMVLGVTSCGKSGPDVAGDVCNKAATCGSLSGISASQCKSVLDMSLAAMPGAARDDLRTAYGACLAATDCSAFDGCIAGLMSGSS